MQIIISKKLKLLKKLSMKKPSKVIQLNKKDEKKSKL